MGKSQRKAASYTKQDWLDMKQASAGIERRLVDAMGRGVAPDAPEAMDLAEEHRMQITGSLYDCTYEIHRGLGQMYVDDHRFRAYYENVASGLARYLRDAIVANAGRAGA